MLFVTVDTPDPYLILRIKTAPEGRRRTKTKDNEVNPVWNEEFTFFLDGAVDNKLRMSTNPWQIVYYSFFSFGCKELRSILFAWSFWFEGRGGGLEIFGNYIVNVVGNYHRAVYYLSVYIYLQFTKSGRKEEKKTSCRFAK